MLLYMETEQERTEGYTVHGKGIERIKSDRWSERLICMCGSKSQGKRMYETKFALEIKF